jgi:hypothetical protein
MRSQKESNLRFLENLLDSFSENVYPEDKEQLKALIREEGLDPDAIKNKVLKSIKKIQLQHDAELTKKEMLSAAVFKQKAIELVESLVSKVGFSFAQLVKEENLAMSFRNVETLSEDDKKNILVKHFMLKLLAEQQKGSK